MPIFWPIKRLSKDPEVYERLDIAERKLRGLDLEFSELYGKVRHALGRIEKRAAIIERDSTEGESPQAESSPEADSPFETLSPAQRALNDKILAARRRM